MVSLKLSVFADLACSHPETMNKASICNLPSSLDLIILVKDGPRCKADDVTATSIPSSASPSIHMSTMQVSIDDCDAGSDDG